MWTHSKGHDLNSNLLNGNQIEHGHLLTRLLGSLYERTAVGNFAATFFLTYINKCISHSQDLGKFIKAAGSGPRGDR